MIALNLQMNNISILSLRQTFTYVLSPSQSVRLFLAPFSQSVEQVVWWCRPRFAEIGLAPPDPDPGKKETELVG